MDSGDESYDEPMSTEMLEDICDGSKSHPSVNRIEACYKIGYRIKQRQMEWKGALLSMQNMVKGLHKVFEDVVNEISQYLPVLGESGLGVFYFIPEPTNFTEVTRFSDDIKKPWLKTTLKEIENLINNKTFLVQDPEKGDSMTPHMDVYKAKSHYDESLYKLKLRIVVRGYLKNKELVGDTWSQTASMRTIKCVLEDAVKHNSRVYQLDFIGSFFQGGIKNRVFVMFNSRYAEYFLL